MKKKRIRFFLIVVFVGLLGCFFWSDILRLLPFNFLNIHPPIYLTSPLPETFARRADQKSDVYLLSQVSVIPMTTDTILRNHYVLLENGIIKEIREHPIQSPSPSTVVVEGQGKYLIPGLADMHIHLNDENNLLLMIANGVLTARNMSGVEAHLALKHRIESGEVLGPDLYTTGPIMEGPHQIWRNNPGSVGFTHPDSVIFAVRRYKRMGYDFLKVYHTLPPKLYLQLIHTAGVEDIPVVGHLPIDVPLEQSLASTHFSIEHISPGQWSDISPELSLKTKSAMIGRSDKWICPTLIVNKKMNGRPGDPGLPEAYEQYVDPKTRRFWQGRLSNRPNAYELRQEMLAIIRANGGNILAGTDAINAYVLPGFSLHEELQELVEAGLSPFEALQASTVHPAEFLGRSKETGTISPGKTADLLLLHNNPLEDIRHTTHIEGVFHKGRWLSHTELTYMLEEVKAWYGRAR
ncbi:MAG: amidohydrolase family protein [Bacteroidota bacterium]